MTRRVSYDYMFSLCIAADSCDLLEVTLCDVTHTHTHTHTRLSFTVVCSCSAGKWPMRVSCIQAVCMGSKGLLGRRVCAPYHILRTCAAGIVHMSLPVVPTSHTRIAPSPPHDNNKTGLSVSFLSVHAHTHTHTHTCNYLHGACKLCACNATHTHTHK